LTALFFATLNTEMDKRGWAKGRFQHALRKAGAPVDFSREVPFRSLGENTTPIVEDYIRRQVGKEEFADPRFRETIVIRRIAMPS
jgi:hypothetical protein